MAIEVKSFKNTVNSLIGKLGYRIVNSTWGPRGHMDALLSVRNSGLLVQSIVDVGASTGVWTEECLDVFPNARYLLIDPLPQNSEHLQKLCRNHENVKFWSGAAGSAVGQLPLHVHGDQSSFLEGGGWDVDKTQIESVEIRPLDDLIQHIKHPTPDFIKADVQGYELEVLRGASECLKHCKLLLLECSIQEVYKGIPLAAEVISFAFDHGFQLYDVCTYAQRPLDGKLCQTDLLFARAGCDKLFTPGYN